ncbi:MAG: V-type ATP synthase subunit F [Firmicutes bacterium]|nr:V-type ATP synthase subunit F [Bacillota bacterium]
MIKKQGKIASLGDKDSILAFRAIGVDSFITTKETVSDELKRLILEHYSVIFITEELAVSISATLEKLKIRTYPAIIPIPTASGVAKGYSELSLKQEIQKALGVK